jgi:predicted alpha/beta superfamily hydrolase
MKEKIYRNIFKNDFGWDGYVDVWLSKNISYTKKTKVIYAHDGQNIFSSKKTQNNQTWEIEKVLNEKKIDAIIIAGTTIGKIRPTILSPYKNGKLCYKANYYLDIGNYGGKGKEYSEFVIKKIIPTILKKHNIPLNNNKYIIGASMGGYINTFILANYPNEFNGYGIFSPAYWFNHDIFLIDAKLIKNLNKKIYIDIGTKEGNKEIEKYYLNDAIKMHKLIKKQNPNSDIKFVLEKNGKHEENAWAKRFKNMIDWLLN